MSWLFVDALMNRPAHICHTPYPRKKYPTKNKKMIKSAYFLLLLLLSIFINTSESRSIITKPQSFPSFKINTTTQNARGCSYTVSISTSCSSVRYTRDQISLSFGDAYGNQVYAPRLDDPSTRTFERCSTDTFEVYGPCTYQICYLYLYRNGYDGWKPGRVEVYGYNTRSVSFNYNTFIPRNIWYGFNYCSPYADTSGSGFTSSVAM